jgi:hypothetical protein
MMATYRYIFSQDAQLGRHSAIVGVVALSGFFFLLVSCKSGSPSPDTGVHRLSPLAADARVAEDDDELDDDDDDFEDGGVEEDDAEVNRDQALKSQDVRVALRPSDSGFASGSVSRRDSLVRIGNTSEAALPVKAFPKRVAAERAVRSAVTKIQKDIKGCFDRHLKSGVESSFTLKVHRTGFVTDFSLPGAPPAVRSCVSDLLNNVQVSNMGGQSVSVTQKVIFKR